MQYAINANFFEPMVGLKKAVELVAKAGFTLLDYTPPLMSDHWKETMQEAMKMFEANGLSVHQTHAPFNRYGRYGANHALCLERCAEATEILGAKFMVAHGDEFDFANLTFSSDAALAYNHDLYLPYAERARKNGYKIAFETVFEDWDRRRYTAKADELMALIRSFDSENVVCCWDFGHGNVAFRKEAPSIIKEFGSLIQCTHLHDNAGHDSHQLPMTGDIDWKETMKAFKEIPYEGVLSVEYSHGSMPECFLESFIGLTYKTTEYLWSL